MRENATESSSSNKAPRQNAPRAQLDLLPSRPPLRSEDGPDSSIGSRRAASSREKTPRSLRQRNDAPQWKFLRRPPLAEATSRGPRRRFALVGLLVGPDDVETSRDLDARRARHRRPGEGGPSPRRTGRGLELRSRRPPAAVGVGSAPPRKPVGGLGPCRLRYGPPPQAFREKGGFGPRRRRVPLRVAAPRRAMGRRRLGLRDPAPSTSARQAGGRDRAEQNRFVLSR